MIKRLMINVFLSIVFTVFFLLLFHNSSVSQGIYKKKRNLNGLIMNKMRAIRFFCTQNKQQNIMRILFPGQKENQTSAIENNIKKIQIKIKKKNGSHKMKTTNISNCFSIKTDKNLI